MFKSRKPAAARPPRPPGKPLFERVQDLTLYLSSVKGTSMFRMTMFVLLVLFIVLLYSGTQYYGLRDAKAMEMGQLGRNLAEGRGYTTQVIRPLTIGQLAKLNKPPLDPTNNTQPELYTPPVYPGVLSVVFRVFEPDATATTGGRTIKADRLMMLISWSFYLLGLLLLYLVSREMFDHRVGVMAAFLYAFCDPLLDAAISGMHLNFLATLFLVAALAVIKAEKWHEDGRSAWWTRSALVVGSLAIAIGTLTDYTFIATALPLLLYIGISFPRQWKRWVILCLTIFGLVWLPWIARNIVVSRTPFGLSYLLLWEGTGAGTIEEEIHEGDLQRTLERDKVRLRVPYLIRQAMLNAEGVYKETLKDVGANYLIMFFLVSLMHRWRNETVYRLRRFVFWSLLFTLGWLSVTGPPERNFLMVFLPVIIIYGSAFFYVMFERLQFRTRLLRYAMVGGFAVLNCVVFVYKILPPKTTVPYPPYEGNLVSYIGHRYTPDVLLASDLPWAMAWYGERGCLYMPLTDDEYMYINLNVKFINAIYLTQATLDRIDMGDVARSFRLEEPLPWMEVFPLKDPPPNFPIRRVQALPVPDDKQYIITATGF